MKHKDYRPEDTLESPAFPKGPRFLSRQTFRKALEIGCQSLERGEKV